MLLLKVVVQLKTRSGVSVIFHFFIFQDGTFLVRDSSRKTTTHPYVLMVLYKDKVYNIQIRYQEQDQTYLLGTGLKGKEVLRVVFFYTASLHLKVPLVLFPNYLIYQLSYSTGILLTVLELFLQLCYC